MIFKIIFENLFGEFIDGALGLSATEAVELGATYKLFAEHTIGFYLFIVFAIVFMTKLCIDEYGSDKKKKRKNV